MPRFAKTDMNLTESGNIMHHVKTTISRLLQGTSQIHELIFSTPQVMQLYKMEMAMLQLRLLKPKRDPSAKTTASSTCKYS